MVERDPTQELEKLLVYLKASRGFDFTAYKRTTLGRRIEKRMQAVGAATYADYQDYLEVRQDEFPQLFNTILINVTSFFRDPEAWEYLSTEVVPRMLEAKANGEPIRVWVAGCASGEEAYTVAMVLAEAMGVPTFRTRVKIYATDLDDEALTCSRTAHYTDAQVASVPAELTAKYFEPVGDKYVFDRELRRSIIFGKHDLIADAPISRVDLLLCRNTLMYFNAEAQERILSRFHFALNEDGLLFLGKAETLLTHTTLFTPVDMKHRVFARAPRGRIRNRSFLYPAVTGESARIEPDGDGGLRDAVFESDPSPQLVVDAAGRITMVNSRARAMFGVSLRDIGRPFQDLEISYRPVELRAGIEQATGQRRTVHHKDVTWKSGAGDAAILNIAIVPLQGEANEIVGASVTFDDVTTVKRLRDELQNFNQELETAYEEVQSTNEELQTTNEELQSTVEELETTNEELHSTNEELETMNEELQSANEDLETINDELTRRTNELDQANAFFESILASLQDGVVVVDSELQIMAWNAESEETWGLRTDEVVGKHLLNLDIGLPVEQLRTPIRTCLATSAPQEISLQAINRRGRAIVCRCTLNPIRSGNEIRGVIVLTACTLVP